MSDLVHAAISENAERRIVWASAVIGLAASLMLLAGCSGGGVDSDGIAAAHDRAGSAEREWLLPVATELAVEVAYPLR